MSVNIDELDEIGSQYLARFTAADLRTLVGADQGKSDREVGVCAMRGQPGLVLDVLDRTATSGAILNLAQDGDARNFTFVSPFLLFAAAIHRTAADLAGSAFAPERAGTRLRVPLFDTAHLVAYLAMPRRRLFLADLLVSFARVPSGVTVTRTARGFRRHRWSGLDPLGMAAMLESVPQAQRPQLLRRLGDVALFMTGVFPDAVARVVSGPFDRARLARRTSLAELPGDLSAVEMMEWFGPRWYRLATNREGAARVAGPREDVPDTATDFYRARRVLNTAADRYLFPIGTDWFTTAARN